MRSDDHDEPQAGLSHNGSDADDDGLPVGGRERPARRYLAIGELLDTLRPEFPDLTLSKIRFLEQQGLLEPERTPSGYRKFFSGQVERLWWILDQQREGYVPLKEIRQRLAAAEAAGVLSPLSVSASIVPDPRASVHRLEPRESSPTAPTGLNRATSDPAPQGDREEIDELEHDEAHDPSLRHAPKEALGESRHPSSVARRVQKAFAVMGAAEHPTNHQGKPTSGRGEAAPEPHRESATRSFQSEAVQPSKTVQPSKAVQPSKTVRPPNVPYGSSNPLISQYTGASFTFDELVRASGLEPEELRQLESYGLVAGHLVLGTSYYDEDALLAANAARGFKAFGIEPRHMRIYRTMADRESGFLEQIVSPLVHRRQDAARTVAAEQLEELIALGTQLRLVALRRLLRAGLDGR